MDETSLTFGVLHNSDHKLFEKHILELAEVAGMEWVDDYDEGYENDYDEGDEE